MYKRYIYEVLFEKYGIRHKEYILALSISDAVSIIEKKFKNTKIILAKLI